MIEGFVHLKLHSEYSMIDGLLRVDDIAENVAKSGMNSVAVTDHVNLFALVKFYRQAISKGIKPIVGADLLVADENQEVFRVTALCKNQVGYKRLTCLLSRAYTEGQMSGQPIIQQEWLFAANEGLIILSGGHQGDVGKILLKGNKLQAEQKLKIWLHYFPNHYYLELQRCDRSGEQEYLQNAVILAEKLQVPVVATNDVRFVKREDFEAHEARVCIRQSRVLNDNSRSRDYTDQQYLKSPKEMEELFRDVPEALENTVEIAKRCNVQLTLGKVFFPNFPVPEGVALNDYFRREAQQGLLKYVLNFQEMNIDKQREYQERLERELNVIIEMGFAGYFLIVADFISWAKRQEIPVGPGRGSGAGSLVAYALGITALDPIQHELLFERFLNPERISLPDFDVDFCMEQRDRVIDYVADRYGHSAVAQIMTYGTMAAKAVVRDVGRVLGMPYGFVDKIAKLVPFEIGMTLEKALEQEPNLLERYRNESEVTTLIDLAMKLEGLPRNPGKHAGGVVIAPTQLTDFVPLYCEPDGQHVVTQFDKDDVEAVGLVKFDFLGLRTLTIIDWAIRTINAKRAKQNESPIDITKIPLNDEKTFSLLKQCSTTAVFQLESRGMKDLIRRLQPDSFNDITALVALFRPGPLQSGMVDDFIDRKHGRAQVKYPHPDIEPILRSTYGVILYQEQVMQIAQVLAGYTLGGADILRRAMGKKKPEEMAEQRAVFTEGALKQGITREVAQYIFDLMEKFAGYGFNKSHSAAYALVSYQTAWLKAHYPAEFMAAVLSSDMDNTDKVVGFVNECFAMQLKILPPNVNQGQYHFTVNENGEIIYGLGAIKGVGQAAVEHIVEEREMGGDFRDLFDFCHRLDNFKVNRRVLEPLVRSGAFDIFGVSRARLFSSIDRALQASEQKNRNRSLGQNDLFSTVSDFSESTENLEYVNVPDWNDELRLRGEKESLGWYISGHPLQTHAAELNQLITSSISELRISAKGATTIAGVALNLRPITTRTGKKMAILTIEDCSGKIDVTLFSEAYQKLPKQIEEDSILIVKGTVAHDDFSGGLKIVADDVKIFDDIREQRARCLRLQLKNSDQIDRLLTELPKLIEQYGSGQCPIALNYQGSLAGAHLALGKDWRVKPSSGLLNALADICGRESVLLEY